MYKIRDQVILENSKDGIEGYITIINEDDSILKDEIEQIIDEIQLYFKYGLEKEKLYKLLNEKKQAENILIAKGKRAINEKDGYIIYNFETNKTLMPMLNSDGNVDYRELDSINRVVKGEVLANIKLPSGGVQGRTVTGKIIDFKKGKVPRFNKGKNSTISNDSLTIQSDVDGLVEIKNKKIEVLEVLTVQNVDKSFGNIDFKGNVIVNGDVLNGYTIKSEGSVEVKGAVEGGYIECDGDILVRRGIQGYNRITIINKGNLCTKFIENSIVNSKGNITSESIMHSDVSSKSHILLLGKNGLIVGGICRANGEIRAKTIGSIMATKTIIEVGIDPDIKLKQENLINELQISNNNLDKLNKSLLVLDRFKKAGKLDSKKESLYNDLLQAKETVYLNNKKVKNDLNVIQEKINRLSSGKVKVSDTIYPGCKIIIGNSFLNITREMKNCTFYLDRGDIRIGPY